MSWEIIMGKSTGDGLAVLAIEPRDPGNVRPRAPHVFRREGDFWVIVYGGAVVLLKDSKGLAYLGTLLRHPGRSFHALELQAAGSGADGDPRPIGRRGGESDAIGMRIRRSEQALELHDAQALAAYRARLTELREEIVEAQALNDLGRTELLQQELDALVEELARAQGLYGRTRQFSSPTERARLNVSRAIRTSIRHLSRRLPSLGQHLRRSVRTGGSCSYDPDPAAAIDWEL